MLRRCQGAKPTPARQSGGEKPCLILRPGFLVSDCLSKRRLHSPAERVWRSNRSSKRKPTVAISGLVTCILFEPRPSRPRRMSRRHSRVSLADRQNEALQEFESCKLGAPESKSQSILIHGLACLLTVKRKYLQYNKQIIKDNSQLRVTVEELKSQLSQLHADNLVLGRSNIALESQLKRERAANKKRGGNGNAVQQADAAVSGLSTFD